MHKIILGVFISLIFVSSLADAKSKKKSGKDKHGAIEEQLEMNTAAIDEIQQAIAASIDPILLAVDCTNGDSISAELARLATAPNHIQINITGVCEEQVFIRRNNVTLSGSGPQDGITGNYAVAATHGVSNVTVRDMTLKGGFAGLTCHQGAAVTGDNLHILNGERGVLAFHNGTCRLIDSLISGNTQGMTIADNSSVVMSGGVIENSQVGANVFTNSSLTLGTVGSPSIVRGNQQGIRVFSNGSLRLAETVIEENDVGIEASFGGSIFVDINTEVLIQNNTSDGMRLFESTNAKLRNTLSIENNGGSGVYCQGAVAFFDNGASFSGNANGPISPACM